MTKTQIRKLSEEVYKEVKNATCFDQILDLDAEDEEAAVQAVEGIIGRAVRQSQERKGAE